MKISIELEISEAEVPSTMEMIKMLKEITENVKIKPNTSSVTQTGVFENKFRSEFYEILSLDVKRNFDEMVFKLSALIEKNTNKKIDEIFQQEFMKVVMDKIMISKQLNTAPYIYLLFHTRFLKNILLSECLNN
jgi:hypothetical protein